MNSNPRNRSAHTTHDLSVEADRHHWIENRVRGIGYGLATVLARNLVRRGRFIGLRSNLAVLHNLPQESAVLEERFIDNLRTAFFCYVDLFIVAIQGPHAVEAAYELDPAGLRLIESYLAEGRGVVVVSAHWSSLDILMLALSRHFPGIKVLTHPQPALGTRLMDRLKGKFGMEMTPIKSASLRGAIRDLRTGGIVGLAVDVPTSSGVQLSLFGRPCLLPIGHTRIATVTKSALIAVVSQRVGPGKYRGTVMEVHSNGGGEVGWAASTLEELERHILARPQEWFGQPSLWAQ